MLHWSFNRCSREVLKRSQERILSKGIVRLSITKAGTPAHFMQLSTKQEIMQMAGTKCNL